MGLDEIHLDGLLHYSPRYTTIHQDILILISHDSVDSCEILHQFVDDLSHLNIYIYFNPIIYLVGGFNPSEKY
jgi:hypothetical protein